MTYYVRNIDDTRDIIGYVSGKGVFSKEMIRQSLQDFLFYEFTLADLGLPPADELLAKTMGIKDQIGLQGWLKNNN